MLSEEIQEVSLMIRYPTDSNLGEHDKCRADSINSGFYYEKWSMLVGRCVRNTQTEVASPFYVREMDFNQ